MAFALGYWAVFVVVGSSGVAAGALFGLVHGLFAGTALVSILLPPSTRVWGTGFDAAGSAPLLEPPGFMLLNYGRRTPPATMVSHIAYGAIVGGFSAVAG